MCCCLIKAATSYAEYGGCLKLIFLRTQDVRVAIVGALELGAHPPSRDRFANSSLGFVIRLLEGVAIVEVASTLLRRSKRHELPSAPSTSAHDVAVTCRGILNARNSRQHPWTTA